MDIVYRDMLSLGRHKYALISVDVATHYSYIYGLTSLNSVVFISDIEQLCVNSNDMPNTFRIGFHKNLIRGKSLKQILTNHSKIIAAPKEHQSSNTFMEHTWHTIVQMACDYITDKQVDHKFCFYTIHLASAILNQVPGSPGHKFITPFELVYNIKPYSCFSICYFDHTADGDESWSNTKSHTLDEFTLVQDKSSNTIIFYSPATQIYYHPPAFCLNKGRFPATKFPSSIKFDYGPTCNIFHKLTDPMSEPIPPGTLVNWYHQENWSWVIISWYLSFTNSNPPIPLHLGVYYGNGFVYHSNDSAQEILFQQILA